MNIAIITGVTSGMGKELAKQIVPQLHKTDEIWLLARRKELMQELARTMRIKTRVIPIDLADERELGRFREVLSIASPRITLLACCAGVGSYGAFDSQEDEKISAMLRLNVTAQTMFVKLCLPYLRKGSRIIQFASGAAFVPQPGFAVYAATKAYGYALARALGRELAKKGIRVTTVCPGPVDTPFLEHAYGGGVSMSAWKKRTMVSAERVVEKAIEDCKRHRAVSVCGLPVQLLYLATQSAQNLALHFL